MKNTIASVLVADPPWRFGDKLPGEKRGASKHYSTLSLSMKPATRGALEALLLLLRERGHENFALLLLAILELEGKSPTPGAARSKRWRDKKRARS